MKQLKYHKMVLPAMRYTTDDIFDNPEKVETLHKIREKKLLDVIMQPSFRALEMPNSFGGFYYLHKSVRDGVQWQFSRLANDGYFNGHTDITDFNGSKWREIMHDMVMNCAKKPVVIEYVTE